MTDLSFTPIIAETARSLRASADWLEQTSSSYTTDWPTTAQQSFDFMEPIPSPTTEYMTRWWQAVSEIQKNVSILSNPLDKN